MSKLDIEERDKVIAKIAKLTATQVRGWLVDRLNNCRRLARQKTGADQDEWLEDAAYFSAAIGLVDWSSPSLQSETSSEKSDHSLIAWAYWHDGMNEDETHPLIYRQRQPDNMRREPWTERPLFAAPRGAGGDFTKLREVK